MSMIHLILFCVGFYVTEGGEVIDTNNLPPYVKQCHEEDPKVIGCLISALHHLKPYLRTGISEIELPSVEPFLMDELSLSLTGGPNGYTIALKDMKIYGASNFSMSKLNYNVQDCSQVIQQLYTKTIGKKGFVYYIGLVNYNSNGIFQLSGQNMLLQLDKHIIKAIIPDAEVSARALLHRTQFFSITKNNYSFRLSDGGKPFEAEIKIPTLKINANYQSSGVLIILPASGNGTFLGQFDDLDCMLRGKASVAEKNGQKYLHVDALHVDLVVKKMRMMVKNIFKNNRILTEAINLFLRENGHEVFKVMLPQLRKKLSGLFMSISNKLLTYVPLDAFYVPQTKQSP